MQSLDRISENYGADTAVSVVRYFLANATQWKGPKARDIKTELKGIVQRYHRGTTGR